MAAPINAALRDLSRLSRRAALRRAALLTRRDVGLAARVGREFLLLTLNECDDRLGEGVLEPGQLFIIHVGYDEDGDKATCCTAALGVAEEVEPGRILGMAHPDLGVGEQSGLEALVALRWRALEYE